MGPILQERTSTILKTVQVKEKVRGKNAENSMIVTSSNKIGGKVNQTQRPPKKTRQLHKNALPMQDKELVSRAETSQNRNRPKHLKSPTAGAPKMGSAQFEADLKHSRPKLSPSERIEERQKMQSQSPCFLETDQSYATREKTRRALSLPLAPHQIPLPKNVLDLESLRLEHKEDDTDSASDLSDSERLPVLPSPCTPPQLNLRAEIINSMDLHPHIPVPRTAQTESESYSYPDFLPPPFNTWSLRQLAVFLNTEGKRAPRPRPVGQLEKYLERLLQLEWHQIQTIQAENGRSTAATARHKGCTPNVQPMASRPHTAPPTSPRSPKSTRQSLRPFPFALLSSLGSPSSGQLNRCLYCHLRYPLCNGSCSSYAYQRHSRLSPLLERKTPPSVAQKRSSSESQASAENRAVARPHHPISPRSHQKCIQAAGNVRKVSHELITKSKGQPSAGKGHNGRAAEAVRHKDPPMARRSAVDTPVITGNKRQLVGTEKREDKEVRCVESGSKPGLKAVISENNSFKASRSNGKLKNAHLFK